MQKGAKGIHHISIISGDGQRNANFYVNILGLRMVMKTVNQDDIYHYHLFYANGKGQPGSSITFFPWPLAHQGTPDSGQATTISFAVPAGSVEFWSEHLGTHDIDFESNYERFGKEVIGFKDPDGLQLELIFDPGVDNVSAWSKSAIPEKYGIRGFWGTTLKIEKTKATADILENILGFKKEQTDGRATLYQTDSNIGRNIILEQVEPKTGKNGRGIVHHVAFRTAGQKEQLAMRQQILESGLHPTEIIDRDFFYSVYFRSPGGVLF
jgi:glyoxalase family protein